MSTTANRWSRILLGLMAGFWVLTLAAGFYFLGAEQFTPVDRSPVSKKFPPLSSIHLDPARPLLIIFAHPQCPCTRASLRELNQLTAATRANLAIRIVFVLPEHVPTGWEKGELMKLASTIPSAQIALDAGGSEAQRFGVKGSGHVLLYSPSGKLLFQGGITPSRGHEGENQGRSAIANLVLHGGSTVTQTPVFGCSLL